MTAAALAAAAALGLPACGGVERPPGAPPQAPEVTPEQVADKAGLPEECGASLPSPQADVPPDFAMPSGRVFVGPAQPSGELLQLQGFVTRTPTQAVKDLLGEPGRKVIAEEDEGVDAEVTFTDGRHRTLFKLVVACKAGSRFTALRAPEPGA